MEVDAYDSRHDRRGKDDLDDEDLAYEDSSRHSSRKKSSRGEDKDRDRDRDREHRSSRSNKERDREKERERKDKEKDKSRDKGVERHKERDRDRERHKEREIEKDRGKEKGKEKVKEKERDDFDKERSRERSRGGRKDNDEDRGWSKDDKAQVEYEEDRDVGFVKPGKVSFDEKDDGAIPDSSNKSTLEIEERILKMKVERLKKQSEGGSEVLAWVNNSRRVEKEKALQLSKIFEEQDNIAQEESDDDDSGSVPTDSLAGVKVLHGLEKVMEGGAVILTLKDQSILADGDVNEEVDMLENVEIGEQKRRTEAYKAAKKKTGIYDDKFSDHDPNSERKILPQYDDLAAEEGLTLDARGHFSGGAEKKLEELRRRLQGASTNDRIEDLTASAKTASDYFTHEEMLQFKKPKKKKSLRKKEKLDLDALEAEAKSEGLGVGDLGSRNDGRRQAIKEEKERSEAEMRNTAFQSAYAKADEASNLLRLEQTLPVKLDEDENQVFADDGEELNKSLARARKLALKRQEEDAAGLQAIARLVTSTVSKVADVQDPAAEESQENRVVFTEVEDFVRGLQLDEESHNPDAEDVFMEEDEAPRASVQEGSDEPNGWNEVKEPVKEENSADEDKVVVPDETLHEVAVGKGLSGALKLLKERGTLKETVDWGGRNMDKKKSKLVGIVDNSNNNNNADHDRFKDIRIERTDEFGRIMTPKEAFRRISHKFHGKGPGKMKQEKRMKQYHEELKLKQMKNSDTPSLSVERMREAQAQLKTPYLVLSGHVKTGENSDARGAFGNVEKDLPGGLTPMLGDKKVEHFLGIKRKAEHGSSSAPKKPKT